MVAADADRKKRLTLQMEREKREREEYARKLEEMRKRQEEEDRLRRSEWLKIDLVRNSTNQMLLTLTMLRLFLSKAQGCKEPN